MSTGLRKVCARRGFTLVELLVVVTIIGILAALLGVAGNAALRAARRAAIAVEIKQLETALTLYAKSHAGGYPPDFAVHAVTSTWLGPLKKQYPRFDINTHAPTFVAVTLDNNLEGVSGVGLDPAEALVFWLGGYSNAKSDGTPLFPTISRRILGFKPSPTKPFITITSGAGNELDATKPANLNFTRPEWAFEFKEERLIDRDNDGFLEYLPPGCKQPYVYFSSSSYNNNSITVQQSIGVTTADGGNAVPYFKGTSSSVTLTNGKQLPEAATTFQIICAGLDNDFGANAFDVPRTYPDGFNYTQGDQDNITSFSEGSTLADKKPEG